MKKQLSILALALTLPAFAWGQEPTTPTATASAKPGPMLAFNQAAYAHLKGLILRSAEKMPEENYGYKPTDGIRTFGQLLGHVADAQYLFASKVLGEADPNPKVEQTVTGKAGLIAALNTAFAYGDKAYASLTDASANEAIKLFGNDTPKLGVMEINSIHIMEHYGNLVTYMRMKNIVPPSSEAGH
jgi:uncharacterized damage-inducible protein DinB